MPEGSSTWRAVRASAATASVCCESCALVVAERQCDSSTRSIAQGRAAREACSVVAMRNDVITTFGDGEGQGRGER